MTEQNSDSIITTANNKNSTINGEWKKKRGSFSLLKAALIIFHHGSKTKPKSVQVEATAAPPPTDDWKKLVGSIRPLHLQDHPSTDSPLQSNPAMLPEPTTVQLADEFVPASPAYSSTSGGTMSQYASANSLQELDETDDDEDEDPDEVFDAITGDEMIDAKADEFIAQFYAQMRRQHVDSVNRHNRRIAKGKRLE